MDSNSFYLDQEILPRGENSIVLKGNRHHRKIESDFTGRKNSYNLKTIKVN